jgi:hypothetical protein
MTRQSIQVTEFIRFFLIALKRVWYTSNFNHHIKKEVHHETLKRANV